MSRFCTSRRLAALLLAACPAWGAVTLVQKHTGGNGFGGSTASEAFTSTVTSGDTVIATVIWAGSASITVSSVTDDKSNTYTPLTAQSRAATHYTDVYTQVWYAINITNAPKTISVTWSANTGSINLVHLIECSASVFDQSIGTTGSSSNGSAGSLTPAVAGEFGAAVMMLDDGSGSGSGVSAGSGWTNAAQQGGGNEDNAAEYQQIAGTSATSGVFSTGSNTGPWAASYVLFKPSGGGGGGSAGTRLTLMGVGP